jgi:hypothetical protein
MTPTLEQPKAGKAPARKEKPRDMTWLGILVLAGLIVSAGWFLRRADASKPKDWLDDQLTYIPSGNMLKPMVLDQEPVVADLLWVRAMIYFADAYLNERSHKWLGHIVDVVTTLNPRLYQAYEFAGVVMAKEKRELPKTLPILERGVAEFPKDWRLRLYAAMGHIANDSDHVRAAEILEPIALEKDVPDHIRTLAATFLDRGGSRPMALAFLMERYVRSDNPIQREIFLERMLKLYPSPPSLPDETRRRVARKVLQEAEVEPMVEQVALGVLGEYLAGQPSQQTLKLLKLLGE